MDEPAALAADDVLVQPTRARLFALLAELRRPAGTVELAQQLAMHPNGVRIHLERLEQAGLITRSQLRHQRGRPADTWTIAADADPGGSAPRGYRDLGRWLARAMRTRPGGLGSIEETGRQIGRELAPRDARHDPDAFMASLVALGFQPSIESHAEGGIRFCLHNCPYADAVHENQPMICALHEGMTRGLLEVLRPHAELAGFVPRDPDEAGCVIELRGAPGSAG